MTDASINLRNASISELDTKGTGFFLENSSLIVHPIETQEVAKDQPLKDLSKYSPKLRILKIGDLSLPTQISLQIEGGYLAEASTLEFDAIGQGETEEEAIQDLTQAIELLKKSTTRNISE